MSIQSEITRISGNVSDAFTAITSKGVTVPAGSTSDDLADLIGQISGGGTGAISIVDTPDAAGGTVRTITAVDISDTTAVAGDVAQGKYFYTADGTKTAGTASGGGATLITKNITANGTYNASSDNADGYSSVTVNVSGGGGQSVSPKQVNFIDYDGTILYAYTAQEAKALSALPANPSHSGLTAQGWNWTLAQTKAQLTAMPDAPVWVGQMYITQSGDTEIDCTFDNADYLAPYLTIAINGSVSVDWGDNTTAVTVTGTSLTTLKYSRHTYSDVGQYTITISVNSGTFAFYNDSNVKASVLSAFGYDSNRRYDRIYASCVDAIRLGASVSVGTSAFANCYALQSITIPDSVTSFGTYAFAYCYALQSVTISDDVTSIGNNTFSSCYALQSIAIPNNVTSIDNSAFSNCYALQSITIPDGVTSIGTYVFQNCYALQSVIIPDGVTSIGNYAFSSCYALQSITIPDGVTSIGNSALYNCYSLQSITIPDDVASIGNNTFQYCYGTKEYHIQPTSVPTGGTGMFIGIVSGTKIYVPSASLDAYKTANNWSTYASYMQGE